MFYSKVIAFMCRLIIVLPFGIKKSLPGLTNIMLFDKRLLSNQRALMSQLIHGLGHEMT